MNIGVNAYDEYGVRVSCTCDNIPVDVNRRMVSMLKVDEVYSPKI